MQQFLNDPIGLAALGLVAFLFLAALGLKIDRDYRDSQRGKK